MSLIEVLAISVALALDAFGVALSVAIDDRINKTKTLLLIFSFGFFQFLFAFVGGFSGNLFDKYIYTLPSLVGGIIILLVGIFMFKEGLSDEQKIKEIHWYIIIILGISVSIDALVVGFSTFNKLYSLYKLFIYSLIVGIVSWVLTAFSFLISKHVRRIHFVKEYSTFLGGVILILFGIKMIFF